MQLSLGIGCLAVAAFEVETAFPGNLFRNIIARSNPDFETIDLAGLKQVLAKQTKGLHSIEG